MMQVMRLPLMTLKGGTAQMIQDLYTFDNPQGSINRSANNAFGRGQIAYKLGSSSDIDALDTNYQT